MGGLSRFYAKILAAAPPAARLAVRPLPSPEEGRKNEMPARSAATSKAEPRRRQPNEVREGSKPERWRQAKLLRSAGSIHVSPFAACRETSNYKIKI